MCGRNGRKLFLAGEVNKALPMSPRRVGSVAVSTLDITVELVGTSGELVEFDICDVADMCDVADGEVSCRSPGVQCHTVSCNITGSGTATLSTLNSACY